MKKILKIFLFLVLIVVLVLGYLGFVPGVSSIMGTNKAVGLGVIASKEALASANSKINMAREDLLSNTPLSQAIQYEGSHPLKTEASSEELTSVGQNGGWEFSPFIDDFQAKLHNDGKVEVASVVKVDKVLKYIEATNIVNMGQAKGYLEKFSIIGNEIPVYTAGNGSVSNGKVTLNLESLKVGKIPVPVNSRVSEVIGNIIEDRMNKIPGFVIKSISIENGKLKFDGSIPDKIKTLKY